MRQRITVIALVATLLGGIGGAGVALAVVTAKITEPNGRGVITACYDTGNGSVRMVNSGARCSRGEDKLAWDQHAKIPRAKVHVAGRPGEPAYQSSMQAYNNPPFGDLSFAKDAAGIVHLTGLACRASGGTCIDGTLIGGTLVVFTLPAGLRPAHEQVFTGVSFGQSTYRYQRVDVEPNGQVAVIAPPNAGKQWMSFDGMSFPAA
jgi:hypothetical protein